MADFPITFPESFGTGAAAPVGEPNVAETRVQGTTRATTREPGQTEAANQDT